MHLLGSHNKGDDEDQASAIAASERSSEVLTTPSSAKKASSTGGVRPHTTCPFDSSSQPLSPNVALDPISGKTSTPFFLPSFFFQRQRFDIQGRDAIGSRSRSGSSGHKVPRCIT